MLHAYFRDTFAILCTTIISSILFLMSISPFFSYESRGIDHFILSIFHPFETNASLKQTSLLISIYWQNEYQFSLCLSLIWLISRSKNDFCSPADTAAMPWLQVPCFNTECYESPCNQLFCKEALRRCIRVHSIVGVDSQVSVHWVKSLVIQYYWYHENVPMQSIVMNLLETRQSNWNSITS